jgi:D-aminoacyl-tRNA deacylase
VIEDQGYRAVGETWVRETSGVPTGLVAEVEGALGSVDSGTRFGESALEAPEDVAADSLPSDLVDVACGIDLDDTRAVLAGATVAYETTDGGSRPTGRVALAGSADRKVLIDGLADVLRAGFDDVTFEGDEIVARETVFDPEKAATLGVPEGPKFGRLAAGEAVEVDGEEIPPEAVCERREVRFDCG